jgi:nucleotide-binding universal stress UspA family protein
MNILVPLDGSELAEYAIGSAAQIARGLPTSPTLLLTRFIDLTPMALSDVAAYYAHITDQAVLAADDYLREVMLRPSLQGITCKRHIATCLGPTAGCIIDTARQEHCELIIMSSHGRSGLASVVLGSVANEVARKSAIPTLILRPMLPSTYDARPTQPFTVLVPLDGSPLAEQVLVPAARIARALHGQLRFLQVLLMPTGQIMVDRDRMAAAEAYLTPLCERFAAEGVPTQQSLAFGDPGTAITQDAQKGKCDLIALATHGRTGVERFFMGSVAGWLLEHARLPLLIVHPHETA